jgi:phosphate-selective porin OprO/OprP
MKPIYLIPFTILALASTAMAQQPEEPQYIKVAQKIELRGLIHTRYQLFEEESRIDAFDLRRGRLDLRGDVAPKIGFRVHTELANGPKILDAIANYKHADFLHINAGQGKHPFSYDNLYSPWNLPTINRTQLDNALAFREADLYGNQNGRDLGLWISGKFNAGDAETKRPILDYTLGVYNGAGINASENNDEKDFGAALGVSPFKDLWIHGRFYSGHGVTLAQPDENTRRERFGINATYKTGRWLIEGEYLKGEEENSELIVLERNGYYLTLGYMLPNEKLQVVARYDNYDPNTVLGNNAINKYVLAANWYFTTITRIQFEYNIVREEDAQVDNNLLAVQFQAAF